EMKARGERESGNSLAQLWLPKLFGMRWQPRILRFRHALKQVAEAVDWMQRGAPFVVIPPGPYWKPPQRRPSVARPSADPRAAPVSPTCISPQGKTAPRHRRRAPAPPWRGRAAAGLRSSTRCPRIIKIALACPPRVELAGLAERFARPTSAAWRGSPRPRDPARARRVPATACGYSRWRDPDFRAPPGRLARCARSARAAG